MAGAVPASCPDETTIESSTAQRKASPPATAGALDISRLTSSVDFGWVLQLIDRIEMRDTIGISSSL